MPDPIVCQHLFIAGRVQGVGFRAAFVDRARQHGLAGWVRNRRDGRVEAVVQGTAAAVQAQVRWCQGGPPMARVDAVEVLDQAPREDLGAMQCMSTA